MKRVLPFLSKAFLGLFLVSCFQGAFAQPYDYTGKKIAFVVLNEGIAGDMAVRDHIQAAFDGITFDIYTEQDRTAQEFPRVDKAVVSTYDLVIVSSSIGSGTVGGWKDLPAPAITWESYGLPTTRFSMVQDGGDMWYGNVPFNGTLTPEGEDHENSIEFLKVSTDPKAISLGLTAGKTGDIEAYSGKILPYYGGTHTSVFAIPNENAIKVLTYDADEIAAVEAEAFKTGLGDNWGAELTAAFVFEKDAVMAADFVAPEKRGFFFFHDNSAVAASNDAWAIFDAMVNWGLGFVPQVSVKQAVNPISVSLYPNPTVSNVALTIESEKASNYKIELFDLTGRNLHSQMHFVSGKAQVILNIEHLSKGVYMVKVSNDLKQEVIKLKKQ
jgi:hypothetical protein